MLLLDRKEGYPLDCYGPRIPDRVAFEKLVKVLGVGCTHRRIADEGVFIWTPPAISLKTLGRFVEALKLAEETFEWDKDK